MAERPTLEDGDYASVVRGLLDDLAGTSITRLELRHGDLRIALRRTPGAVAPTYQTVAGASHAHEPARPAHWHAVESPLTGIFYGQPSPDDEPFVAVGSHVEPDQVVGLIETMKMFNEVTSEITGAVRELLVENGSLVQAGQTLMYIEPTEGMEAPPVGGA